MDITRGGATPQTVVDPRFLGTTKSQINWLARSATILAFLNLKLLSHRANRIRSGGLVETPVLFIPDEYPMGNAE